MKIKCMIVDDEPHAIRVLETYVKEVPQLELVGACNNAVDAFDMLRDQKIDLVFLDIKMPVITGIDFLKTLTDPPKIIFTTAYRDYALEGFDLDATDYLLKPISFNRFLMAVGKAGRQMQLDYHEISALPDYSVNKQSFLYFKVDKAMKKIMLEDLLYLEGARDYTKFFLLNSKVFLVRQSMNSLEIMLSGHRFMRVHRSFMVAINKIDSFNSCELVVSHYKIPIGRLYKEHVMKMLDK